MNSIFLSKDELIFILQLNLYINYKNMIRIMFYKKKVLILGYFLLSIKK